MRRTRKLCDIEHCQRFRPKVREQQSPMILSNSQLSGKCADLHRANDRIGAVFDLRRVNDGQRLHGVAGSETVRVGHCQPGAIVQDCDPDGRITDANPTNECVCRIGDQVSGIEGENHVVASRAHVRDVTARRSDQSDRIASSRYGADHRVGGIASCPHHIHDQNRAFCIVGALACSLCRGRLARRRPTICVWRNLTRGVEQLMVW